MEQYLLSLLFLLLLAFAMAATIFVAGRERAAKNAFRQWRLNEVQQQQQMHLQQQEDEERYRRQCEGPCAHEAQSDDPYHEQQYQYSQYSPRHEQEHHQLHREEEQEEDNNALVMEMQEYDDVEEFLAWPQGTVHLAAPTGSMPASAPPLSFSQRSLTAASDADPYAIEDDLYFDAPPPVPWDQEMQSFGVESEVVLVNVVPGAEDDVDYSEFFPQAEVISPPSPRSPQQPQPPQALFRRGSNLSRRSASQSYHDYYTSEMCPPQLMVRADDEVQSDGGYGMAAYLPASRAASINTQNSFSRASQVNGRPSFSRSAPASERNSFASNPFNPPSHVKYDESMGYLEYSL